MPDTLYTSPSGAPETMYQIWVVSHKGDFNGLEDTPYATTDELDADPAKLQAICDERNNAFVPEYIHHEDSFSSQDYCVREVKLVGYQPVYKRSG